MSKYSDITTAFLYSTCGIVAVGMEVETAFFGHSVRKTEEQRIVARHPLPSFVDP